MLQDLLDAMRSQAGLPHELTFEEGNLVDIAREALMRHCVRFWPLEAPPLGHQSILLSELEQNRSCACKPEG